MTSTNPDVPDAPRARTVPRRAFVAGLVGAGALGVGGTAAAAATGSGPRAGLPTPGETLMTEHGVLKRVLLVYRAALSAPLTPARVRALHTAAGVVRDYVEGFHESLEEVYVFPPLLAAGRLTATVDTLLVQHGRGRLLTADVTARTAAGTVPTASDGDVLRARLAAFVRMYEPHEAHEDTEVYPALRDLLGDRRTASLGERFESLQARAGASAALEPTLDRVRTAEAAFGLDDLAAFTPAAPATGQ